MGTQEELSLISAKFSFLEKKIDRSPHFEVKRIQPKEAGDVALVVSGCVGFHRRDLRMV